MLISFDQCALAQIRSVHLAIQKPVLLASPFRQMGFAGHLFVFIRQANGNGPSFSWLVPGRDITVVGPFPEGMSL